MIISDLEHLEAVCEESQIEGGLVLLSGSSSSVSGYNNTTSGGLRTSSNSVGSFSETPFSIGSLVLGTLYQANASSSVFGATVLS